MLRIICMLLSAIALTNADVCNPSSTTASGPSAPQQICSGQLIFNETFDNLDKKKRVPLVTFWDGGNDEFQWYVADAENSFAKDGKLYITPTMTVDQIGEDALQNGHIHLDDCTDFDRANCDRQAGGDKIINPVRSARLMTEESFSFKYGRIEVMAKIPEGDWLWPAIWFLPTRRVYGDWTRSGEIDLMEATGNLRYGNEGQIGVEQVGSTLHFGPDPGQDRWETAFFSKNDPKGFHTGFHKYEMVWNEAGMKFLVDGNEMGHVGADEGFCKRGGLEGDDIWEKGTKMAPFDQEFHLIINLPVGGNFFPDLDNQNGRRPWNNSQTAMKDFWNARGQWQHTWRDKESSSFQIDDIKIWAL